MGELNGVSKNSTFRERLIEAMEIRKLRQSDLCEITGIPKSAMSQYVKGSFEPKQDRLWAIAKALNVNEAWLMGYAGVCMERKGMGEMGSGIIHQMNMEALQEGEVDTDHLAQCPQNPKIPLLKTVSPGYPLLAAQNISKYITVPEGIHADYAVKLMDDQMDNGCLHKGTIVYAQFNEMVELDIPLVLRKEDGTLYVRRLKQLTMGDEVLGIQIVSDNPEYPPVNQKNLRDCEVVGWITGYSSSYA